VTRPPDHPLRPGSRDHRGIKERETPDWTTIRFILKRDGTFSAPSARPRCDRRAGFRVRSRGARRLDVSAHPRGCGSGPNGGGSNVSHRKGAIDCAARRVARHGSSVSPEHGADPRAPRASATRVMDWNEIAPRGDGSRRPRARCRRSEAWRSSKSPCTTRSRHHRPARDVSLHRSGARWRLRRTRRRSPPTSPSWLFPSQSTTLDAAKDASLAAEGLTEDDRDSHGVRASPQRSYRLVRRTAPRRRRSHTPRRARATRGVGGHRHDPGATAGLGRASRPGCLQSGSQFRPDGPPVLDSGRYASDYNEIKAIGSKTSATRTSEQTEIARFWLASPGCSGTASRARSSTRGTWTRRMPRGRSRSSYLAGADASIACWDAKYTFNYCGPWRRSGTATWTGTTRTVVDAAWEPLFPTPPHPEYLSGHTTNSSAMASTLEFLFGDAPGVSIVGVSPTNPGFTRHSDEVQPGRGRGDRGAHLVWPSLPGHPTRRALGSGAKLRGSPSSTPCAEQHGERSRHLRAAALATGPVDSVSRCGVTRSAACLRRRGAPRATLRRSRG